MLFTHFYLCQEKTETWLVSPGIIGVAIKLAVLVSSHTTPVSLC